MLQKVKLCCILNKKTKILKYMEYVLVKVITSLSS